MSDEDFTAERVERDLVENEASLIDQNEHVGKFAAAPTRLDGELDERRLNASRALKYHNAFLDDCLRALLPNDLVLLGAPTGLGKTDLAMNIATTNAVNGKRVHYFALEAEPRELERRTKFALLSGLCYAKDSKVSNREKMNYADWLLGKCEDICGRFNARVDAHIAKSMGTFNTFYRGNSFNAKDLEKHIIAAHKSTDLIVVDHLHYIDNREDANEASALGETVKTIRDVALNVGKPVLLIAHLRKKESNSKRLVPTIDDFHGSSNITKICTHAITIERCSVVETANWWQSPTFFSVLKDRRSGALPYVAVMEFDRRTKSYAGYYTLGKLTKGSSDWEPIKIDDKPEWAINHRPLAAPPAPPVAVQEGWRMQ